MRYDKDAGKWTYYNDNAYDKEGQPVKFNNYSGSVTLYDALGSEICTFTTDDINTSISKNDFTYEFTQTSTMTADLKNGYQIMYLGSSYGTVTADSATGKYVYTYTSPDGVNSYHDASGAISIKDADGKTLFSFTTEGINEAITQSATTFAVSQDVSFSEMAVNIVNDMLTMTNVTQTGNLHVVGSGDFSGIRGTSASTAVFTAGTGTILKPLELTLENLTLNGGISYTGAYVMDVTLKDVIVDGGILAEGASASSVSALKIAAGGSAELDGVTVRNFNTAHSALDFAADTTLTITDSVFDHNTNTSASGTGGAISFAGTELTITDSTFSNNKAEKNGGAICVSSGRTGILTISGSTFEENSSTSGNGGAIYTDATTMSISDSVFRSNTATAGQGGAMYIASGRNTGSKVAMSSVISNTLFDSNSANAGGAVYLNTVVSTMRSGANTSFEGVTMVRNTAKTYGGGIFVKDYGFVNIVNSTLVDNSVNTASNGGSALYIDASTSANARVFLYNSIFVNWNKLDTSVIYKDTGLLYSYYSITTSNLSSVGLNIGEGNTTGVVTSDLYGTKLNSLGTKVIKDWTLDENNLLQIVVTGKNASYVNKVGFLIGRYTLSMSSYSLNSYAYFYTTKDALWHGFNSSMQAATMTLDKISSVIMTDATGYGRIGTYTTGAAQIDPAVAWTFKGDVISNYSELTEAEAAIASQSGSATGYTLNAMVEAMGDGSDYVFYMVDHDVTFADTVTVRGNITIYGRDNKFDLASELDPIFNVESGSLSIDNADLMSGIVATGDGVDIVLSNSLLNGVKTGFEINDGASLTLINVTAFKNDLDEFIYLAGYGSAAYILDSTVVDSGKITIRERSSYASLQILNSIVLADVRNNSIGESATVTERYSALSYGTNSYEKTKDTTFQMGTVYYVLDGKNYRQVEVVIGAAIPESVDYYVKTSTNYYGVTSAELFGTNPELKNGLLQIVEINNTVSSNIAKYGASVARDADGNIYFTDLVKLNGEWYTMDGEAATVKVDDSWIIAFDADQNERAVSRFEVTGYTYVLAEDLTEASFEPGVYYEVNTYKATADTTFQEGKCYYVNEGTEEEPVYTLKKVTAGVPVPSNTYYEADTYELSEDTEFDPDKNYFSGKKQTTTVTRYAMGGYATRPDADKLIVSIAEDIVADDAYISLREALIYAQSIGGGTITFSEALNGQTITLGYGKTFNGTAYAYLFDKTYKNVDITILGKTGTDAAAQQLDITIEAVSGKGTSDETHYTMFGIYSGKLTLDSVTLTGGKAVLTSKSAIADLGLADYSTGQAGTLTLNNVTVKDIGTADDNGSNAQYSLYAFNMKQGTLSSALNIKNSAFENIRARNLINANTALITIENTSINGNSAVYNDSDFVSTNQFASSIFNITGQSTFSMTDSVISQSAAKNLLTVSGSKVAQISLSGVQVYSNVFSDVIVSDTNSMSSLMIDKSVFASNIFTPQPDASDSSVTVGVIKTNSTNFLLSNSTITGHRTGTGYNILDETAGNGYKIDPGLVYYYGVGSFDLISDTITNNVIWPDNVYAVYSQNQEASVYILNSIVLYNCYNSGSSYAIQPEYSQDIYIPAASSFDAAYSLISSVNIVSSHLTNETAYDFVEYRVSVGDVVTADTVIAVLNDGVNNIEITAGAAGTVHSLMTDPAKVSKGMRLFTIETPIQQVDAATGAVSVLRPDYTYTYKDVVWTEVFPDATVFNLVEVETDPVSGNVVSRSLKNDGVITFDNTSLAARNGIQIIRNGNEIQYLKDNTEAVTFLTLSNAGAFSTFQPGADQTGTARTEYTSVGAWNGPLESDIFKEGTFRVRADVMTNTAETFGDAKYYVVLKNGDAVQKYIRLEAADGSHFEGYSTTQYEIGTYKGATGKFQAGVDYFTYSDGYYHLAEVTVGEEIPAGYYIAETYIETTTDAFDNHKFYYFRKDIGDETPSYVYTRVVLPEVTQSGRSIKVQQYTIGSGEYNWYTLNDKGEAIFNGDGFEFRIGDESNAVWVNLKGWRIETPGSDSTMLVTDDTTYAKDSFIQAGLDLTLNVNTISGKDGNGRDVTLYSAEASTFVIGEKGTMNILSDATVYTNASYSVKNSGSFNIAAGGTLAGRNDGVLYNAGETYVRGSLQVVSVESDRAGESVFTYDVTEVSDQTLVTGSYGTLYLVDNTVYDAATAKKQFNFLNGVYELNHSLVLDTDFTLTGQGQWVPDVNLATAEELKTGSGTVIRSMIYYTVTEDAAFVEGTAYYKWSKTMNDYVQVAVDYGQPVVGTYYVQNQERVLDIKGTDSQTINVAIRGISISDGVSGRQNIAGTMTVVGNGGLIYIDHANVTVENASLYNGQAAKGGAIYLNSGSLTVTDTVFGDDNKGNTATYGGAVYAENGTVTIGGQPTYTEITDESAKAVDGKIYYMYDSENASYIPAGVSAGDSVTGLFELYSGTVTFASNTASHGAAVYFAGNAVVNMTNAVFTGSDYTRTAGYIVELAGNAKADTLDHLTFDGFIGYKGAISIADTVDFNKVGNTYDETLSDITVTNSISYGDYRGSNGSGLFDIALTRYEQTTDTKAVEGHTYYKYSGGVYTAQTVTAGKTVVTGLYELKTVTLKNLAITNTEIGYEVASDGTAVTGKGLLFSSGMFTRANLIIDSAVIANSKMDTVVTLLNQQVARVALTNVTIFRNTFEDTAIAANASTNMISVINSTIVDNTVNNIAVSKGGTAMFYITSQAMLYAANNIILANNTDSDILVGKYGSAYLGFNLLSSVTKLNKTSSYVYYHADEYAGYQAVAPTLYQVFGVEDVDDLYLTGKSDSPYSYTLYTPLESAALKNGVLTALDRSTLNIYVSMGYKSGSTTELQWTDMLRQGSKKSLGNKVTLPTDAVIINTDQQGTERTVTYTAVGSYRGAADTKGLFEDQYRTIADSATYYLEAAVTPGEEIPEGTYYVYDYQLADGTFQKGVAYYTASSDYAIYYTIVDSDIPAGTYYTVSHAGDIPAGEWAYTAVTSGTFQDGVKYFLRNGYTVATDVTAETVADYFITNLTSDSTFVAGKVYYGKTAFSEAGAIPLVTFSSGTYYEVTAVEAAAEYDPNSTYLQKHADGTYTYADVTAESPLKGLYVLTLATTYTEGTVYYARDVFTKVDAQVGDVASYYDADLVSGSTTANYLYRKTYDKVTDSSSSSTYYLAQDYAQSNYSSYSINQNGEVVFYRADFTEYAGSFVEGGTYYEQTYTKTTDTVFQNGKKYYTWNGSAYVAATVSSNPGDYGVNHVGDTISGDYYVFGYTKTADTVKDPGKTYYTGKYTRVENPAGESSLSGCYVASYSKADSYDPNSGDNYCTLGFVRMGVSSGAVLSNTWYDVSQTTDDVFQSGKDYFFTKDSTTVKFNFAQKDVVTGAAAQYYTFDHAAPGSYSEDTVYYNNDGYTLANVTVGGTISGTYYIVPDYALITAGKAEAGTEYFELGYDYDQAAVVDNEEVPADTYYIISDYKLTADTEFRTDTAYYSQTGFIESTYTEGSGDACFDSKYTDDLIFQEGKTYYTQDGTGMFVQAEVIIGGRVQYNMYYELIAVEEPEAGTSYLMQKGFVRAAVEPGALIPADTYYEANTYTLTTDSYFLQGREYYTRSEYYAQVEVEVGTSVADYYVRGYTQASGSFAYGINYFTLDQVYTRATVTAGEAIPVGEYYTLDYSLTKDTTFREGTTYYTKTTNTLNYTWETSGSSGYANYLLNTFQIKLNDTAVDGTDSDGWTTLDGWRVNNNSHRPTEDSAFIISTGTTMTVTQTDTVGSMEVENGGTLVLNITDSSSKAFTVKKAEGFVNYGTVEFSGIGQYSETALINETGSTVIYSRTGDHDIANIRYDTLILRAKSTYDEYTGTTFEADTAYYTMNADGTYSRAYVGAGDDVVMHYFKADGYDAVAEGTIFEYGIEYYRLVSGQYVKVDVTPGTEAETGYYTVHYTETADDVFGTGKYYTIPKGSYVQAVVEPESAVPANTYYEAELVTTPTFQKGTDYYVRSGDVFVKADVRSGDTIPVGGQFYTLTLTEDPAFEAGKDYYKVNTAVYLVAGVTAGAAVNPTCYTVASTDTQTFRAGNYNIGTLVIDSNGVKNFEAGTYTIGTSKVSQVVVDVPV